jgi:hypothetical protein
MGMVQMYTETVFVRQSLTITSMTIVQTFEVVHEKYNMLGDLYQWRLRTKFYH